MSMLARSFSKIMYKDERLPEHVRRMLATLQRQIKVFKSIVSAFAVIVIFVWMISIVYKCEAYERKEAEAGLTTSNYLHAIGRKSFEEPEKIDSAANVPSYSENELIDIKSTLNARRAHLQRYCESLQANRDNLENVLSNLIVDTEHGIAWCPIYKVASSTWMKKFAALGGALTDTTIQLIRKDILQLNNIVRQIYPREPDIDKAYHKLNQTKKFLIVRHPLERLVSAYRDKLENMKGREYYYKRFGRHIAHRYRRFREANDTRIEPTFRQFLQFIIDEKYFDEHWAPFFHSCEPCSIPYDYILKFETLERDQHLLIRDLDLDEFLPTELGLRNENPRGPTTDAVVEEYKSQVPKELLHKIYKVYEHDFQAFSYKAL